MIRVLLVDDQPIFREGVKRVLESADDMAVTGEASSSQEALEQASLLAPDVVLLDLSMPEHGGLDTVQELRRRNPEAHVLMLTVHPEDRFAVLCFMHGADGYLVKDAPPQQLVSAIRKLYMGGKYLTESLAEQLVAALNQRQSWATDPHDVLSRRQLEIMRLLASGLTSGRIAERLQLSVKTVSTHRSRILRKMHMTTTAELMRYAVEWHLSC